MTSLNPGDGGQFSTYQVRAIDANTFLPVCKARSDFSGSRRSRSGRWVVCVSRCLDGTIMEPLQAFWKDHATRNGKAARVLSRSLSRRLMISGKTSTFRYFQYCRNGFFEIHRRVGKSLVVRHLFGASCLVLI